MTSNLKTNEKLQAQHLPAAPAQPVGADEPVTSGCLHEAQVCGTWAWVGMFWTSDSAQNL